MASSGWPERWQLADKTYNSWWGVVAHPNCHVWTAIAAYLAYCLGTVLLGGNCCDPEEHTRLWSSSFHRYDSRCSTGTALLNFPLGACVCRSNFPAVRLTLLFIVRLSLSLSDSFSDCPTHSGHCPTVRLSRSLSDYPAYCPAIRLVRSDFPTFLSDYPVRCTAVQIVVRLPRTLF